VSPRACAQQLRQRPQYLTLTEIDHTMIEKKTYRLQDLHLKAATYIFGLITRNGWDRSAWYALTKGKTLKRLTEPTDLTRSATLRGAVTQAQCTATYCISRCVQQNHSLTKSPAEPILCLPTAFRRHYDTHSK
jgi:hypothetical protein